MSSMEYEKGEHSIEKNLIDQIDLWSNLDENGSDRILTESFQQVDCQEQVFQEYKAGLIGFEDQPKMFEMHNDRLSSLSSMDMLSKIDVGQVVVNPNILLLEDVWFKAEDVVQVSSYKMDCQMRRSDCHMWMADCQNSYFLVLQILELQIGQGGMHNRMHNDKFLHFVDQITSKWVQRILEDYLQIIYFTFTKISNFKANLACAHQYRVQSECQTLMWKIAIVVEDQSSGFEMFKSLMLMRNVQDVFIVKKFGD